MIVMYLRKSRTDDASMTVNEVLAKHETILQEYAVKEYGKPIPEQFIYREIVSGETISDRPQMQTLLDYITNNDVDGVLVVEPQRLSRGDLVDCGTICRIFKYTNTKIITPKWTFDLTNDRDLQYFETELRRGNDFLNYIIDILKRGKYISAQSGQYIFNAPPYGYDKITIDGKKTLAPNADADIVKYIFEMTLKGWSPYHIAKDLNEKRIAPPQSAEWSQKTIYKIIRNIHYIGKIKYQERPTKKTVDAYGNIQKIRVTATPKIFDGLHPPIIDEQLFNDVQDLIGRNTRKPNATKFASPFASLVKCGICGTAVTLQTYGGNKKARMACRHQSKCHNHSVSYHMFTDAVIKALKAKISDFSVTVTPDNTNTQNGVIKALQADLLTLEKRIQKIYYAYENNVYTDAEFIAQKSKAETERNNLEKALQEAQTDAKQQEHFEAFEYSMYQAIDSLKDDTIPPEAKNHLLKRILKKIEYTRTGDDINIELYF